APLDKVAEYLVGCADGLPRDCLVVNAQYSKGMDMRLLCPAADLVYTPQDELQKGTYAMLDGLISAHRTTLVFTNTRSGTERIVHSLKEFYPGKYESGIEAHHSSLSREDRRSVEDRLKRGELKAVVCSTSLELGIDIGYIDLVVQVGSPKSVARALQRTGRSGHDIYKISESRLIASDRDDLVEMGVMLCEAKKGRIDRVSIPENCLDVLAQHLVGMAIEKSWAVDEAYALVCKSYCYRTLSKEDFMSVLRFLSGGFGSLEKYRVYGKVWFDEGKMEFGKRGKMLRVIYSTNIGTIPDEVSVTVLVASTGRHIGQISEEFLSQMKKGDRFVLGGRVHEFNYAKGMKCYVSPAAGLKPTIPQWFSEMLPLSFDLASAISRFRGALATLIGNKGREEVVAFIEEECSASRPAAEAIYDYFVEQISFLRLLNCNSFHSERNVIVEEFLSEGKRHFIVHSLFGRRANEVLAKTLAARVSHEINRNVIISFNDNGFVLTLSRAVSVDLKKHLFVLSRLDLAVEAREAIAHTETLKRKFRHVAVRSLMILRNYMGREKSVGKQQMSAHMLFGISSRLAGFPVVKETYREILEDQMDIKAAGLILQKIRDGEIALTVLAPYDLPSPFAHLLITQGISDVVLYADRKALLENLHTLVLRRLGRPVPERARHPSPAPVSPLSAAINEPAEQFNPISFRRGTPRKRPRWQSQ
ncbi:MAG: helicase-related protein, partial [Candidatus Micrarchaeota archaeon]